MLKKEILDTLKQTALVLSFLLIIPIVFWINSVRLDGNISFIKYLEIGRILDLQLLIAWLAYGMFANEDSEDAEEYLQSLPYSKWKLLGIKILPRIAIVWLLDVVVSLPTLSIRYSMYNSISTALLLPVLVMFSGFILGISERRNPVLILCFVLLITYSVLVGPVIASLFLWSPLHEYYGNLYLILRSCVTFLPLFVTTILLVPIIKKWDCSSARIRSQRILKRVAVPVVVVVFLWGVLFSI